jgi:hypothetical protein
MKLVITYAGKEPVTTYVPITTYVPEVVAWQISRDFRLSVPLYSGPEGGEFMRKDGAIFTLDR